MKAQQDEIKVNHDILETERDSLNEEKRQLSQQRQDLVQQVQGMNEKITSSQEIISVVTQRLTLDSSADAVVIQEAIDSLHDQLSEAKEAIKAKASESTARGQDHEALESQHSIELSEKDSKIRELEEVIHSQTRQVHGLSKRVTDLQSELSTMQAQAHTERPGPAPRQISQADSLMTSGAAPSPSASSYTIVPKPLPPPASVIDATLPPSLRRKRHVSLNLLKTRMSGPPPSLLSSSSSHTDARHDAASSGGEVTAHETHATVPYYQSQISDEAVFWCAACQGDLITL